MLTLSKPQVGLGNYAMAHRNAQLEAANAPFNKECKAERNEQVHLARAIYVLFYANYQALGPIENTAKHVTATQSTYSGFRRA
jgi:hypothetical protein